MSTILQVTGGLLVLIGAVAFVLAYLKSNISKTTVSLYKEDNAALRSRLATIEEDERIKDKRLAELAAKIEALEKTREELLGVITQKDAIARIERALAWLLRKDGVDYERGI